jgi:hypothetical protein
MRVATSSLPPSMGGGASLRFSFSMAIAYTARRRRSMGRYIFFIRSGVQASRSSTAFQLMFFQIAAK